MGERERRGEREQKNEGEVEEVLSLFYSHFLPFSPRYDSLHKCFWTYSDDVATLFTSSSLTQSFSISLYFFNSHTLSHAHYLSLSLSFPLSPLSLPISPSLSLCPSPPFHLRILSIFCVSDYEFYRWYVHSSLTVFHVLRGWSKA